MAKLYVQEAGKKPMVVGNGDRSSILRLSYKNMVQNRVQPGLKVDGTLTHWGVRVAGTKQMIAVLWIEFSDQHVASAPIPDFCRAPAGAP